MKRIISAVLLALMITVSFAACSKSNEVSSAVSENEEFVCDLCKETKTGEKHEVKYFGQDVTLCPECYIENIAIVR